MTELYHHGIKGQRWGVRRFQNKDGSYTAAGKKRYQATNGDITKKYDIKNDGGIHGEAAERFYNEVIQDPRFMPNGKWTKMIRRERDAVSKIFTDPKYQTSIEKEARESFKRYSDLNTEYWKTNGLSKRIKINKAREIAFKTYKELSNKALNDKETQELLDKRNKKIKSVQNKYYNKEASTILRDLGFEDDQKSRDFVIDLMLADPDDK